MIVSTLCYLEKDGKYLMLRRDKKICDPNKGKWIGVGGKLEENETPEQCIKREVKEETGLTLSNPKRRGVIAFKSDLWEDELIYLYVSDDFCGDLAECNEGTLKWIDKNKITDLNIWEGDRIFLNRLLSDGCFMLELSYQGDNLVSHKLLDCDIDEINRL